MKFRTFLAAGIMGSVLLGAAYSATCLARGAGEACREYPETTYVDSRNHASSWTEGSLAMESESYESNDGNGTTLKTERLSLSFSGGLSYETSSSSDWQGETSARSAQSDSAEAGISARGSEWRCPGSSDEAGPGAYYEASACEASCRDSEADDPVLFVWVDSPDEPAYGPSADARDQVHDRRRALTRESVDRMNDSIDQRFGWPEQ